MRGELLFAAKKYDDASKEFQRAMYGYGGEQASAEAKNWQAKSGYEAGRCAEVQISTAGDAAMKKKYVADAERCYRFVVERHLDHGPARFAKQTHDRQRRESPSVDCKVIEMPGIIL